MSQRKVIFDHDCDEAAEALGGHQSIDQILFGFLDALQQDPTVFPKIETDWGSARYIRTKRISGVPELIWLFLIEANGDVTIVHVEIYDGY